MVRQPSPARSSPTPAQPRSVPALGSAARRQLTRSAQGPGPAVTDASADALPTAVARILGTLPIPSIWVAADGSVPWVHPALDPLRIIRRGSLVVPEITRLLDLARSNGQALTQEVSIRRPGRRQPRVRLRVRVSPMEDDAWLILVEDVSEEERLDRVRRDFVANVSHELKTPVGALSLLAEAVAEAGDEPEVARRFSGRILAETRRLATLVNDLLDLSRLEGIDPEEPPETVSVDDVVGQACDDALTLARERRITYLRGGVPGLTVRGVESQLVTAVRNLIVNAINYSPPATKVAVTTGLSGGWVTIAVTDQGIGIPPAEVDRIFERFYRVDPARSRDTGGTGLGLAIVKHVCARHGGDCDVWSRVGEGSTFTMRLPPGPGARSAPRRHPHPLVEEDT